MSVEVDLDHISVAALRTLMVPPELPISEQYRTYYGRGLNMARIESAIRDAECGLMVDLCDLETESLGLDPHLSGILGKRFGSLSCLDWDLTPAQGEDIEKGRAELYANEVRSQLTNIPNISGRIYDLAWGLFDGRSALEIYWERMAGPVPWVATGLGWVHPRRLSYGPERELFLIDTFNRVGSFQPVGIRLDDYPGKFLTWQPRLFREYPEREGLGPRTLYWSFFKRFSWRMRMILTELFGIPWRIVEVDPKAQAIAPDATAKAKAAAERLGAESTASFGPGQSLKVVQPTDKSTDIFSFTNEDVDKQMSKLVLGNTGTTEGGEANRANAVINKSEQEIVLSRDAAEISERIQSHLVDVIVALNWGQEALRYSPTFQLRADPERDREKELGRVDRVFAYGMRVPVSELVEITGIREPDDDEPYLIASPQVDPATGQPTRGPVLRVDPSAEAEMEEEDDETSAELAPGGGTPTAVTSETEELFVTVNEQRALRGLGPLTKEDGSEDPMGAMTIAAYKVAMVDLLAASSAASALAAPEPAGGSTPAEPSGGPEGAPEAQETAPEADPSTETMEDGGVDAAAEKADGDLDLERAGQPITLPFAGYADFDACVLDQKKKGHDDESARRICGALQEQAETAETGKGSRFSW
jgi:phage gp29-like protein